MEVKRRTMTTDSSHKSFLTNIADEIHKRAHEAGCSTAFEQQLRRFRETRRVFEEALANCKTAAENDPRLRYGPKDPQPAPPPSPEHELEQFFLLDTYPKAYWRLPLPFDPDAYLVRFQCEWLGFMIPDKYYRGGNQAKATKEQKLACEYALIATIHDRALEIPPCNRLTNAQTDDWADALWRDVSERGCTGDDRQGYADRRKRIATAFNDVRAHLDDAIKAVQPNECKAGASEHVEMQTGSTWENVPHTEVEQQNMSNPADNSVWEEFLDRIAVGVDELIIDVDNLKVFRDRIRPFAERWKKHVAESMRAAEDRIQYWQKVKANSRLQDKAAGRPKKGWEWDGGAYLASLPLFMGPEYEMPAKYAPSLISAVEENIRHNERRAQDEHDQHSAQYKMTVEHIDVRKRDLANIKSQHDRLALEEKTSGTVWIQTWLDPTKAPPRPYGPLVWYRWLDVPEEEVFGCWRPPLKEVSESPCERLIPPQGTRKLLPARDRTEEYERYYVSLSSVHDNRQSGSESITKPVWPDELARDVWFRFSRAQPCGPDRAFIEIALNRVKADLEAQGVFIRESGQPPAEAHDTGKTPEPLAVQPTKDDADSPRMMRANDDFPVACQELVLWAEIPAVMDRLRASLRRMAELTKLRTRLRALAERKYRTLTRYRMKEMGQPFPGWVWDGRFGCWRPNDERWPFDPADWFQFSAWYKLKMSPEDREPKLSDSEKRLCDDVFVSAVHDQCAMKPTDPKLNNGIWTGGGYEHVQSEIFGVDGRGPHAGPNVDAAYIRQVLRRAQRTMEAEAKEQTLHAGEAGKPLAENGPGEGQVTAKIPPDVITSAVAIKEFCVSPATLRRAAKDGRLQDYRAPGHAENAPLQLSRTQVARYWPKRQ